MSAPVVRPLGALRKADAAEVGGKAAQLGELIAAGARVPDGLVLTVAGGGLPADERGTLLQAGVADLGSGPFAVRSSGVAEDGAERSFAGMYATVLDVSVDQLPAAADHVLASAQAARAQAYTATADDPMAVIVQRMVASAAAGVALTADPISGDRNCCVVTAVRGLGERRGARRSTRSIESRPCAWRVRLGASRLSWAFRRTSSGRSIPTANSGSCRPDR